MGDCPLDPGCLNDYKALRQFALLAGDNITVNALNGNIIGNIGADTVVGVTDAIVRKGRVRTSADPLVVDALGELSNLYTELSNRTPTSSQNGPIDLGGQTFECGVYNINGNATINSDIFLNGLVIFQITGNLTIGHDINFQLSGDNPTLIYFVVGGTIVTGDNFQAFTTIFISQNEIAIGEENQINAAFAENGSIQIDRINLFGDPLEKLTCDYSTSALNPDCASDGHTRTSAFNNLKRFSILAQGDVVLDPTSSANACVGSVNGTQGECSEIIGEAFSELGELYTDLITREVDLNVGTELGTDSLYLPAVYRTDGSATISEPFRADISLPDPDVVIVQVDGDLNVTAEVSAIQILLNHKIFFVATGNITITGVSAGGNYIAQGDITVTDSTIDGSLYSTQGTVTVINSSITHNSTLTLTCGDPHILCLDGSRLDVYDPGFYRLFTYHNANETVVINAEIVRNKKMVDLYKQAWIYCQLADRITRMQLTFLNKVVEIKDLETGQTKTVPKWEQAYTTLKGEQLSFIAESIYNTIGLSSYGNKSISFSGLFAGDIKMVDNLYDTQLFDTLTIEPNYYDSNAIISASALPHIKTIQGKEFKNRFYNIFRLLEWKNESSKGIINVELSVKRYVKSLYIETVIKGKNERHMFKFEGKNHWQKKLYVDGQLMTDQHYVYEKQYQLGEDKFILFRVQNNASVSAAFRNVNQYINGLFLNNPHVIHNIKNTELMGKSIPVDFTKLTKPTYGSLWQRYAEPFLTV